jgi:imidazolonepropionase-like amidohydrolase
MSLHRFLTCCLFIAVASLALVSAQRGAAAAIWFEGARLIVGDGSAPIDNAAFLVEGESFAWVGKQGQRQPPQGAMRVDLSGKTVMPALIDGHNHIGLVNEKDGSNSKANYKRENLVDQLQRYAYYGTAATMSMGPRGRSGARVSTARRGDSGCGALPDGGQRHRGNADRRAAW